MDERVAMAISHWAPRFTMNGVTAGDFERITSGLTSWNDWCAAWSKVAAEHESLGREALTEGQHSTSPPPTFDPHQPAVPAFQPHLVDSDFVDHRPGKPKRMCR